MTAGILILAATIAGSIQAAVDKTLAEHPQLVIEDPAVAARLAEMDARDLRNETIRDETLTCISESLIATGVDIGLTEVARNRCETCGELNVAGFNDKARTGLKFSQAGAEVALCLLAAKHRAADPDKSHRHGKWIARIARWAIVANNLYAVVVGRPLLKFGGSAEALK